METVYSLCNDYFSYDANVDVVVFKESARKGPENGSTSHRCALPFSLAIMTECAFLKRHRIISLW